METRGEAEGCTRYDVRDFPGEHRFADFALGSLTVMYIEHARREMQPRELESCAEGADCRRNGVLTDWLGENKMVHPSTG